MATSAPRTRARETLTAAEVAALTESAARAGGWRALAREWEGLNDTTLRRAARGVPVTALVLHAIRAHLPMARGDAPPPRHLRALPAVPPGVARALPSRPAPVPARKARGA